MSDLFKKMTSNLTSKKIKAAKQLDDLANPNRKRTCSYVIAPASVMRQFIEDDENFARNNKENTVVKKRMTKYIIAPASLYFQLLKEDKEADEKEILENEKNKNEQPRN